jgi:non-ribosomal peptide synthetase component F
VCTGTSQFDLTLYMVETSEGLQAGIEYNTDLFVAATVERLLAHYQALLAAAVANPEARLSALPPAAEELPRPVVVSAPAVPAPDSDARRARLAARMSKLPAAQREALEKKLQGGGAP